MKAVAMEPHLTGNRFIELSTFDPSHEHFH